MKSSLLELRAQLLQVLKLLKIDSLNPLHAVIGVDSSMTIIKSISSDVGEVVKILTHLGEIEIRKFGNFASQSGRAVVCLNGINPKLVNEWVPVAERLGAEGHRVVIIDFHSNAKTKPKMLWGGISDVDVQLVIKESVISKLLRADKVSLLGKSWGGKQAALFTQRYPNLVSKLGLVCPASSEESIVAGVKSADTPVYLAWAKDDFVKWYSNVETWRRILGESVEVQTAESGGHSVLPEYTASIVKFVNC